jgi:transposase
MSNRTRPTFSPKFRLEVAQLVVNQGCSIRDTAEAMGVGKSTMDQWVRQLRAESYGIPRIRELEKRLRRVEEEKEILIKATQAQRVVFRHQPAFVVVVKINKDGTDTLALENQCGSSLRVNPYQVMGSIKSLLTACGR